MKVCKFRTLSLVHNEVNKYYSHFDISTIDDRLPKISLFKRSRKKVLILVRALMGTYATEIANGSTF